MNSSPAPQASVFTVDASLHGERLDRGLAQLLPDFSRGRLREMIEDGRVQIDGELAVKPSRALVKDESLTVDVVLRDRSRRGSAEGIDLSFVYEDDAIAVLDKPPRMVTHPSDTVRGGTLSELLAKKYGALPELQGEDRPGIVHRLDADTSGLMVIARTEAAGQELLRQFREREVEKTYLAIVYGEPRFDSDWITGAIGRSPHSSDRMAVVDSGEGRAAETFYSVRERFVRSALLECQPKTGRTHQIRVHLASIGHSVVGDRLYRAHRRQVPKLPPGVVAPSRQALHAAGLTFTHPLSGERLTFDAPLPADLSDLLTALRSDA